MNSDTGTIYDCLALATLVNRDLEAWAMPPPLENASRGHAGGPSNQRRTSALVIASAVVVHCTYQTDWQLVAEFVNKTQAEFQSLSEV